MDLQVRIGDSLKQATFHIVDKVVVNVLFGTNFMDKNIFGLLPQSKKRYYVVVSQFQYKPRK